MAEKQDQTFFVLVILVEGTKGNTMQEFPSNCGWVWKLDGQRKGICCWQIILLGLEGGWMVGWYSMIEKKVSSRAVRLTEYYLWNSDVQNPRCQMYSLRKKRYNLILGSRSWNSSQATGSTCTNRWVQQRISFDPEAHQRNWDPLVSARVILSATTVPNPAHAIPKVFLGLMFQEEEEEAGVCVYVSPSA